VAFTQGFRAWASGRTVDFRNTVVIMTSNIGSEFLLEGVMPDGEVKEEVRDLVKGCYAATSDLSSSPASTVRFCSSR
jgi:ATP-dependent Clp protease ATP-binding subunit ClpA